MKTRRATTLYLGYIKHTPGEEAAHVVRHHVNQPHSRFVCRPGESGIAQVEYYVTRVQDNCSKCFARSATAGHEPQNERISERRSISAHIRPRTTAMLPQQRSNSHSSTYIRPGSYADTKACTAANLSATVLHAKTTSPEVLSRSMSVHITYFETDDSDELSGEHSAQQSTQQ